MAGGEPGATVIPALAVAGDTRRRAFGALIGTPARLEAEAGSGGKIFGSTGSRSAAGVWAAADAFDVGGIAAERLGGGRTLAAAKPAAVFSMGGYVAGPVLLAALWKRVRWS